jgi:hypothetical protein
MRTTLADYNDSLYRYRSSCKGEKSLSHLARLRVLPLTERFSAPQDAGSCPRRYYGDYQRFPRIPVFFLLLHHPFAAAGLLARTDTRA